MSYVRFAVGRWLILWGLRVMPPGRVRRELNAVLCAWSADVRIAVARSRAAQGTEARRAETLGSVHDGPVAASDAPE